MRILRRIIGTNVILKEMGVTDNDKCSFCLIAKDTDQYSQPNLPTACCQQNCTTRSRMVLWL